MGIKDVLAAAQNLSDARVRLDLLKEKKQAMQAGLDETNALIPPAKDAVDAAKVALQAEINALDLT